MKLIDIVVEIMICQLRAYRAGDALNIGLLIIKSFMIYENELMHASNRLSQ